jgi:hypothetical protein
VALPPASAGPETLTFNPRQPISDEESRDLLQTMDGAKWANAFCRATGFSDEGWALTWFCNAIMATHDYVKRQSPPASAGLVERLRAWSGPVPPTLIRDVVAALEAKERELARLRLEFRGCEDELKYQIKRAEKAEADLAVCQREDYRAHFEACDKQRLDLLAVCHESNAVCVCGCPDKDHESYGEEGEACQNEMHECIRTSKAVYAIVHALETLRKGQAAGTKTEPPCETCTKYAGQMMPSHIASKRCESGRRNHCSCDICF